jgi:hypothetical protein
MIERRRSLQNATMCPMCGAHMRAATAPEPQDGAASAVWRCIRCGGEIPRLARRATDPHPRER